MTKKTSVAYRISEQALESLEIITQATGITKTAAVEMALAVLANQLKGDTQMAHNRRRWLEQKFFDLQVGDFEEMGDLTDDQLESLIREIEPLLEKYPDGVESNEFMGELEVLVNSYIE
ncbi:MAG: hypothetical protein ACOX5F_00865 [Anaerovoracaceae bacterium]|jgi:hypothetical protein